MNKYIIVCYEEWENGVRLLPRIEYTIAAESQEKAVESAFKRYPQYHQIGAWEAQERPDTL